MEIKYALILVPLFWSIMIYVFSGTFVTSFATNLVSSFIITAIVTATLSGLHVLDSGLSDGATYIIFILIFGGLFYGISVGTSYFVSPTAIDMTYIDGTPITGEIIGSNTILIPLSSVNSITGSGSIYIHGGDMNWSSIPTYIETVKYPSPIGGTVDLTNPYYDNEATATSGIGFGMSANSGLNNSMFTEMPYFTYLNLIFAVMYMFGLYMMVATK